MPAAFEDAKGLIIHELYDPLSVLYKYGGR
jgi:hypothetical protein